jgi:transposase
VSKELGRLAAVGSCYEESYDGFWLHRLLQARRVDIYVFDPASLQVNRRARRATTDRIDAAHLQRAPMAYLRGEKQLVSVVRVPSMAEEDARRLHRERAGLINERSCTSASKGCAPPRASMTTNPCDWKPCASVRPSAGVCGRLVSEVFYRGFNNRRQLGGYVGLTPSPFQSGATHCNAIKRLATPPPAPP